MKVIKLGWNSYIAVSDALAEIILLANLRGEIKDVEHTYDAGKYSYVLKEDSTLEFVRVDLISESDASAIKEQKQREADMAELAAFRAARDNEGLKPSEGIEDDF